MALNPKSKDTEHFFHSTSPPRGDTSPPTTSSTPRPANFLEEEPEEPEVTSDLLQQRVVFLSQSASCGRVLQHGSPGVTEYANYTISHLEAEVNSKHLPKKYRCRFCVYKTSYKSDLNRHLRKHGVALQHCHVCNMPFKTAGNLDNHVTQYHAHLVQSMGNVSPSLSTPPLKGAFVPTGSVSSSPDMVKPRAVAISEVPVPVADAGGDQQTAQSVRDCPAVPQSLRAPHQLHCHVCPFGSNDAQVLARHILTHPGEEEVSRAPQSSPQNLATVPGFLCGGCSVSVSSEEDLKTHTYYCTESVKLHQDDPGERVWAPDSRRGDPTKHLSHGGAEVGDKFGFPQRDTINKLKRALSRQSVCQTSSSPTRQVSPGKKRKTSMMLPHVPAAVPVNSVTADQNQTESVYRPAPRHSPGADVQHGEASHVPESAVQRAVSSGSAENRARTSDESRRPSLSTQVCRSTAVEQGHAQPLSGNMPQTAGSIQPSESRLRERGQNSDLSLQGVQSAGRRQRSASVSSTERDKRIQKETEQRKDISTNEKRTSASLDSQTTGYKRTHYEDESSSGQCTPRTVLVKEEPQSPTASVDLEESEKTCETCPGTRSDLVIDSPRRDTSERECRLCGQLFRDRAHLMKHVQHIHFLATEPRFSSFRIPINTSGPGQRQKLSTHGSARVSENSCLVPKSQDHLHSNRNTSHNKDVSGQSLQTHFFHHGVVPEPPPRGRYAMLVSNFDDFASKPYACSLCFFRTAHLSELSHHVDNHLTGGSPLPASNAAGFQSKTPLLVERGASPFKVDSADGLSFEPMTVPDSASSAAINASFENLTGVRLSTERNNRLQLDTRPSTGQSEKISSCGEVPRHTHGDDRDDQTPVSVSSSVVTSKSCHHLPATESARSTLEPRPENHSPHVHGVGLVPATMTAAMDLQDASDCADESQHCSEGCADRLMGAGRTLQSQPESMMGAGRTLQSQPESLMGAGRTLQSQPESLMGAGRTLQSQPESMMGAGRTLQSQPESMMGAGRTLQSQPESLMGAGRTLQSQPERMMGAGRTLQSQPVQADIPDSRDTPPGSTGSQRNALLHDASQNARHIQKQSVMSTRNSQVVPNPSVLTGKGKRSLLRLLHRSSKNPTQRKPGADACNSRWQHHNSKVRVARRSGQVNRGYRRVAAGPQTHRCEHCNRCFTGKQMLVRHVRLVHPTPGSVN